MAGDEDDMRSVAPAIMVSGSLSWMPVRRGWRAYSRAWRGRKTVVQFARAAQSVLFWDKMYRNRASKAELKAIGNLAMVKVIASMARFRP